MAGFFGFMLFAVFPALMIQDFAPFNISSAFQNCKTGSSLICYIYTFSIFQLCPAPRTESLDKSLAV